MELTGSVAFGAAVAGILAGFGYFVRRFSRDKLEYAKDRAEEELITHLTSQRDTAITEKEKAQKELLESLAELSKVDIQIRELRSQNSRLSVQVSVLTNLVEKLTKALETSKDKVQAAVDDILSSS